MDGDRIQGISIKKLGTIAESNEEERQTFLAFRKDEAGAFRVQEISGNQELDSIT